MERIESTVLKNLIYNEDYMRKVFPFLKKEYFTDSADSILFDEIDKFVTKYNACPTVDALEIQISNSKSIPEHTYTAIEELFNDLKDYTKPKFEWLVDETEKFCKDKSVYNAIVQSVRIIEGKDTSLSADGIPSVLQDALAVCFDTNVGHDYFENEESRFEFYHKEENRIPFDIDLLNKITNGGLPNKTLTVLMGGTGTGKSLVMCHMAATNLNEGKNVLYITMEMAEERIAERIDANLMDINLVDLKDISKDMFMSRVDKIKQKTQGKLIIKEYPTASAHAGHFKMLLNELSLKKSFVPDIIYIAYLNICASSRYKASSATNSYTLVKAIAEELRGLAQTSNLPIISATQTNREGISSSDMDLTNTSESIGLAYTVDLFLALITTEDLENMGQLMIKQLKNRFGDPNMYKRFVVGIDRSKMKLYNLDNSAQKDISDKGREQDGNNFGRPIRPRDFSSIKF